MSEKLSLIYTIYTDSLYGTERMSLATAWGLRHKFSPTIILPPGPASLEAQSMGFAVIEAPSARVAAGLRNVDYLGFAKVLMPIFRANKRMAFISTNHTHSLIFAALNLVFRRKVTHLYVMHGPPRIRRGQRFLLNILPMKTIAISSFTRACLISSGVKARKITIIENFLSDEQIREAPTRRQFDGTPLTRVAIVSRLVPLKRLDLLLDCLEQCADLSDLEFHIYGSGVKGEDYESVLRARVAQKALNVIFEGFSDNIPLALARSDLLVHLSSDEPFGLVVLEAMAARIPVIVPDEGGAASLIAHGVSGFRFQADNAMRLGYVLREARCTSSYLLNKMTATAASELRSRFSESARVADYCRLLESDLDES